MQDLASEFSKIFRGWYPQTSTAGGATPSRTQHPAWLLAGHGAQAPRCWDPNLGPPQLFSRGCTPIAGLKLTWITRFIGNFFWYNFACSPAHRPWAQPGPPGRFGLFDFQARPMQTSNESESYECKAHHRFPSRHFVADAPCIFAYSMNYSCSVLIRFLCNNFIAAAPCIAPFSRWSSDHVYMRYISRQVIHRSCQVKQIRIQYQYTERLQTPDIRHRLHLRHLLNLVTIMSSYLCIFCWIRKLPITWNLLSYDVCLEVRGKIIRTVLCCIVYRSCAQS